MKLTKTKATIEEVYKGMFGLVIDSKVAAKVSRRVVVKVSKDIQLHVAIQNRKDALPFVYLNKKHIKELKLNIGSIIPIQITEDKSQYEFEESKELNEVLKTDPLANKKFKSLTDGNKRSLIYLVTKLKSTDKRIAQALHISICLRAGITTAQQIVKTKKQVG
jgi:hypothetical protein